MPHPAYILSGGESRRFGSDKSRHELDGQPQLLRLSSRLRQSGHDVFVVADRAERYADLGITCLIDEVPGSGPLAGLATALAHRGQMLSDVDAYPRGWLLLVNCDQLRWDDSWYDQLALSASSSSRAVAFFDQFWQPLPGLYHCSLLELVRQKLYQRQLSLHNLLDEALATKITTTTPPSQWSFNEQSQI